MSASAREALHGTPEQALVPDSIDQLLTDWARERPDLDFSPVGIINRLARVRAHLDSALLQVFRSFSLTSADFRVIVALRRAGWHHYSLFMRDDGLLFGYFETPESFQKALDAMTLEAINAKWQAFMAPYFENLGGAHADQNIQELVEVFHLD